MTLQQDFERQLQLDEQNEVKESDTYNKHLRLATKAFRQQYTFNDITFGKLVTQWEASSKELGEAKEAIKKAEKDIQAEAKRFEKSKKAYAARENRFMNKTSIDWKQWKDKQKKYISTKLAELGEISKNEKIRQTRTLKLQFGLDFPVPKFEELPPQKQPDIEFYPADMQALKIEEERAKYAAFAYFMKQLL